MTLTVSASGGGYDGRTANVVVRVKDTGAAAQTAGDSDGDGILEALLLLEGVTREAAAAALFGAEGLSDAQLEALDLLGNRNGGYDLGDLLSLSAQCRRGKATCGRAVTAAGVG